MEHTYLRYECADTFGLTVSTGSSKAPFSKSKLAFLGNSKNAPLLTVSGSVVSAFNLKSCALVTKIGHRELLPGGIGTGLALNSGEIVCLDVLSLGKNYLIATGWVDGAVRVFEIEPEDIQNSRGLVRSLLHNNIDEDFIRKDPLLLDGQSGSPIRAIKFDPNTTSRLAAGSSDGSVVLWDIVSESGLFRLIGHRGGITGIEFMKLPTIDGLITCSLDGLIKIWNLGAQCCIQTLASNRGEVWTMSLMNTLFEDGNQRRRLIAGGSDGKLRVWKIAESDERSETNQDEKADEDDICHFLGTIEPPPNVAVSSDKIVCTVFHPSMNFCGVLHSNSRTIDVYSIRNEKEALKRKARRLKRRQEKEKKRSKNPEQSDKGRKRGLIDDDEEEEGITENVPEAEADENETIDPETRKASDEFEYLTSVRASHKIHTFQFVPSKEKGEILRVVSSLSTNAIETHIVKRDNSKDKADRVFLVEDGGILEIYGHPTGVRAIALSSDDSIACTVSKNAAKIWNVSKRTVVQSITPNLGESRKASCYCLCATFLPGNTHVLIGTREGHLMVIDIALGDVVVSEEKAHDGAVWSVHVRKNSSSERTIHFLTGSADKTVKFWSLETDEEDNPCMVHSRTLQLTDEVICARYSYSLDPTKRMVFVSTIDSNIKVFYDDSLKLFLSLYGHKLPALSLDSSDDDVILASGGADKSIKIWGLDFGDTHKTLHGHEDSITDIRFVSRSHNFFTSSKDGSVRFWDGDRFEQVLYLSGHFAEVNCLAVSRTGAFVLSGSMDRQIRVWERTKDIVFVEEEKERYLEMSFDKVDSKLEASTSNILDKDNGDEEVREDQPQSEAAVRKSLLSVSAGDRILEAIEMADKETKDMLGFRKLNGQSAERRPNLMMMSMDPPTYVLWVLKSIKNTELEQSLLVLPLSHVERLIYYLLKLLEAGNGVEICSRVAIFLAKYHQNQVSVSAKKSHLNSPETHVFPDYCSEISGCSNS